MHFSETGWHFSQFRIIKYFVNVGKKNLHQNVRFNQKMDEKNHLIKKYRYFYRM